MVLCALNNYEILLTTQSHITITAISLPRLAIFTDKNSPGVQAPVCRVSRMLQATITFLLIVSACSGQRSLKRWQSLSQPATRGEAFPEQWLEQIRDHFDATNTARWPQRYWENLDVYRGEGLAFLHIGGEAEASPGWLEYGAWYKWAQENGAAMFVLEHRYYGASRPVENMTGDNMRWLSSRQVHSTN